MPYMEILTKKLVLVTLYGLVMFAIFLSRFLLGIVLGVVSYGGMLLATNQLSPGELMSFLVATQTIQR